MDSVLASIQWIEDHDPRLQELTRMEFHGELRHEYLQLSHQYDLAYDHLLEMARGGSDMAEDWLEKNALW